MLQRFFFLIISQVTVTIFLYREAFSYTGDDDQTFAALPPKLPVVLSRIVGATFLHINQADEINAAFKMMKYTLNHPWKFENWKIAFIVNFMQFFILALAEGVSLCLIYLQYTVMDVLMNFISLTVITCLDDYLFQTLYENPFSQLI